MFIHVTVTTAVVNRQLLIIQHVTFTFLSTSCNGNRESEGWRRWYRP